MSIEVPDPKPTRTGEIRPGHPGYHEPVPAVKVAKDKAVYVRQQKGHSLILHLFVIGPFTLWIPAIYIAVSPNHYWHA